LSTTKINACYSQKKIETFKFSAWTKEDEVTSNVATEEKEEKKTFNSSYDIIIDYSEYSTIQV
jgi:hypothetical protein